MVENKFQILRLETSPCSGRHRESMKITGKMDWNCCNWMSISDYYLRKWPAPDCPLNPLQRVALHTRHAGRVLPRLAQDSVTRRGLRIEDDHSRWAASTTRWIHSGSASSCQPLECTFYDFMSGLNTGKLPGGKRTESKDYLSTFSISSIKFSHSVAAVKSLISKTSVAGRTILSSSSLYMWHPP